MCGIVDRIGQLESTEILLTVLSELKDRSHDSKSIAVLEQSGVQHFRADYLLVTKLGAYRSIGSVTAIGPTRRATHGKPTEANSLLSTGGGRG